MRIEEWRIVGASSLFFLVFPAVPVAAAQEQASAVQGEPAVVLPPAEPAHDAAPVSGPAGGPVGAPPAGYQQGAYPAGAYPASAYPAGAYPAGAYPAPPPGAAPPMGYPPPGAYRSYPPPGAYPGYPPPPLGQTNESLEEADAPAIAPHRPFRFRADYGMGYFNPSDVNAYMEGQIPSNAIATQGFSEMVLLLSAGVSVAYYPMRFFGVRPNLLYLFAPKILTVEGGSTESFWLHSLAPGLSVDFAFDQGKLSRFFASPGLAYHLGWFEGYSASGLGLSLALGAELSFGQARKKGMSIALVLRKAKLGVNGRPSGASTVAMDNLDFTSALVCVGFQAGL